VLPSPAMTRVPVILLASLVVLACSSAEQVPEVTSPPESRDSASAAAPEPVGDEPERIGATPSVDAPPPSVDRLTPYFDEAPLDGALADYLAGRNTSAAEAFAAFHREHPDDVRARPARFMALLSRHDAGDVEVAGELEAMAGEWPVLDDYARFYAGSAHLQARRWDDAIRLFDLVPSSSTLWPRARESTARAHIGAGRPELAITTLEQTLAEQGDARSTSWVLLADLYGRAERPGDVHRARVELAIRFASLPEGRAAFDRLGRKPRLDADQRYRLGRALANAQRHAEALRILGAVEDSHPQHCQARYLEARAHERMKNAARAWPLFEQVLACDGDIRADATFAGGRNRVRAGDLDNAEKLLLDHVARYPERTTVDDALVLLAEGYQAAGRHEEADATLLRVVTEMHGGDEVDQAAWRLVWPRIADERYEEALAMADRVLAVAPRETHYRAEGRMRYWRGRLLLHLDRPEEARAEWARVLAEHPLSWYAVLAYSRLHAHDPELAREARAAAIDADTLPDNPLEQIPERLWRDANFQKAVELARLGLAESAQRELGETPRAGRDEREAWLWTQVALYHMAGGHHLGMRLARPQEPHFGRHWPRGHMKRLWQLAHPTPFEELVTTWSETRGIDPYWVWSIMREESSFNPRVESWANAIGLMQIILPTAEFLARGTDIAPTRENLQRPEVAIELGTKYLERLLEQHPSLPLASAGYNAGGGSVNRWRRAFGDRELDEFVERITFREARGYAKRVTRSIARYHALYREEMLVLSLDPPGPP